MELPCRPKPQTHPPPPGPDGAFWGRSLFPALTQDFQSLRVRAGKNPGLQSARGVFFNSGGLQGLGAWVPPQLWGGGGGRMKKARCQFLLLGQGSRRSGAGGSPRSSLSWAAWSYFAYSWNLNPESALQSSRLEQGTESEPDEVSDRMRSFRLEILGKTPMCPVWPCGPEHQGLRFLGHLESLLGLQDHTPQTQGIELGTFPLIRIVLIRE